jgi:hypothetical protein
MAYLSSSRKLPLHKGLSKEEVAQE